MLASTPIRQHPSLPCMPSNGWRTALVTISALWAVGLQLGVTLADDQSPNGLTFSGMVVDDTGSLLAGATVTIQAEVYQEVQEELVVELLARTISDEQGRFSLSVPFDRITAEGFYSAYVLVEDTNLLGWKRLDELRRALRTGGLETLAEEDLETKVPVGPTHDLVVRLVTSDGEPVVATNLQPTSLFPDTFSNYRDKRRRNSYIPGIRLPPRLRQKVVSSAEGEILIRGIPQAGTLLASIGDNIRNRRLGVAFGCEKPTTIRLDRLGGIRGTVTCREKAFDTRQVEIIARLAPPKEASGPQREAHRGFLFSVHAKIWPSENGEFHLAELIPGEYSVRAALSNGHSFYPLITPNQTVTSGPAAELQIEFRESSRLLGRVVDADSGDGVQGVTISLNWNDESANRSQWFGMVESDEDGEYVGFGRPGRMMAYLGAVPPQYRAESAGVGNSFSVQVEPDVELTKLPDVRLVRGAELTGVVVDPAGEPQSHAEVYTLVPDSRSQGLKDYLKTDGEGRFKLVQIDPEDTLPLRAASGSSVTNGAVIIDAAEGTETVQLIVSPDHSFFIEGRLATRDGRPVQGATVALQWHQNYVSRKTSLASRGTTHQRLETDQDGHFRTRALWAGDRYRVRVTAEGFRSYETVEVAGVAGKTHDFGQIRLTGTSGVVSGRVVDTSGRPIPQVEVFNRGDGPSSVSTMTDTDGRFTLRGLLHGAVFVLARKQDLSFSGRLVESPAEGVVLTLQRRDQERTISTLRGFTHTERKAIAEELLHELYALPLEQRHQINFLMMRYMARANPSTAMHWLGEPANGGRRDDVLLSIAESIIDEDPDEALSLIRLAGRIPFGRLLRLANQVRTTDRETALTLAKEVVDRARQGGLPNRIYQIAQSGRLLVDLSEKNAGHLLLDEAFEAATRLGGDAREGFVRGFVAEQLAASSVDKALRLVDGITEIRSTSKLRHLGNVAVAIAPNDPARAVELAYQLDGRAAVRVAYHVAIADYERAMGLVANLKGRGDQRYRAEALAWIALARRDLDPKEALQLIDQSFEILLTRSDDFDRWTNYGFEAVPAAHIAALASKMKHPNVSSTVMRAIAARRNAGDDDEVVLLQAQAKMAKFIALADRNAAKQLLWQLDARKELLGGGGYQSIDWIDWLTGWCLADRERGKEAFQDCLKWELERGEGQLGQGPVIRVIERLVLSDTQLHSELARDEALWYPGNE